MEHEKKKNQAWLGPGVGGVKLAFTDHFHCLGRGEMTSAGANAAQFT